MHSTNLFKFDPRTKTLFASIDTLAQTNGASAVFEEIGEFGNPGIILIDAKNVRTEFLIVKRTENDNRLTFQLMPPATGSKFSGCKMLVTGMIH